MTNKELEESARFWRRLYEKECGNRQVTEAGLAEAERKINVAYRVILAQRGRRYDATCVEQVCKDVLRALGIGVVKTQEPAANALEGKAPK